MTSKTRKERLSIYLVKDGLDSLNSYLKLDLVENTHSLPLDSGEARVFIKREPPSKTPAWAHLLVKHPGAPQMSFGKSASVGAVLEVRVSQRIFLLSFGTGFHLVRADSTERDFGLRVTLNSVDPLSLRSLDKASYDDSPLSARIQSTLNADIFDLQANSESDLIYAVTGACTNSDLGSHVTGRDALTLMIETDIPGICSVLETALDLFNEPLPSAYSWVDNVSRVRDPDTIELLDLLLDDMIEKKGSGSLWIGEPEIVDWETNVGYSFDMRANTPRHQTLQLDDLRQHIASKGLTLSVATLKASTVHVNNSLYQSIGSWTGYRCLYAELAEGADKFALRNGSWFRIDADFIKKVDDKLLDIPVVADLLPMYSATNEGDYNSWVAATASDIHLMDKKNVQIGGPLDKVEFCDLIKGDTNLIHVKYYRSSATLSHLFLQGLNSAETFVKDEGFRVRLNTKLPQHIALADTKARPNAHDYTITYAIATNKSIPLDLPFFSKVSLKNAAAQLQALGYKINLTAIPIDPKLLTTKKYKPKKV